jgi:hypothetical protein
LNPFRFGFFSFFLLSHKILRFLVPFFLLGTFFTNLFLLHLSSFYYIFLVFQILAVAVILAASLFRINGRVFDFCKYLLVTLSAQMVGWKRMILGSTDTTWIPQRSRGK